MNNNLYIIHRGYSYYWCTPGKSQIMPAVLRRNIHNNLASLRISLGFPHWLSNSPWCFPTSHNRSHGATIPVIRDPSYSDGQPEYPSRVWFSPEFDASKFTLRLLSDTPGGSQWLKYILQMMPYFSNSVSTFAAWSKSFSMVLNFLVTFVNGLNLSSKLPFNPAQMISYSISSNYTSSQSTSVWFCRSPLAYAHMISMALL